MKIHAHNVHRAALSAYAQSDRKSPERHGLELAAPEKDALELSVAAKALSSMMKEGAGETEISQRALEIKAQLKQGTYTLSLERLSERLTERVIQERKIKE